MSENVEEAAIAIAIAIATHKSKMTGLSFCERAGEVYV